MQTTYVPTADSEDYNNDIDSLHPERRHTTTLSTQYSNFSYSPSVGFSLGSTYLSTGSPPVRSLSMGSPIGPPLDSPMGSPPMGSPIDSHIGSPIGSSIGFSMDPPSMGSPSNGLTSYDLCYVLITHELLSTQCTLWHFATSCN